MSARPPDISVALAKQPAAVRDNTRVIFITTAPERDTPTSLRKWLKSFGPNCTGLSGDLSRVKNATLSLGIYVEEPKKPRRHRHLRPRRPRSRPSPLPTTRPTSSTPPHHPWTPSSTSPQHPLILIDRGCAAG
ncbi:SCO family protein [Streptomyces sp. NPDC005279]